MSSKKRVQTPAGSCGAWLDPRSEDRIVEPTAGPEPLRLIFTVRELRWASHAPHRWQTRQGALGG